MSIDYVTAIAEYHQVDPRPGTLIGYDVRSGSVADLTAATALDALKIDPSVFACPWFDLFTQGIEPPSWTLADHLIAEGAHGALVPSVQRTGATNLVLWRWHRAGTNGEGAAVTLIDPTGDLIP